MLAASVMALRRRWRLKTSLTRALTAMRYPAIMPQVFAALILSASSFGERECEHPSAVRTFTDRGPHADPIRPLRRDHFLGEEGAPGHRRRHLLTRRELVVRRVVAERLEKLLSEVDQIHHHVRGADVAP
jgi:hypothetical protein